MDAGNEPHRIERTCHNCKGKGWVWADPEELTEEVLSLRDQLDGKDRIIYDAIGQVKSVIEHMPMDCQIYVREGASDENVYASLAVSVAKLTGKLRAVQADLRELRMEKEGINEQDIAETMPPRQGH